MADLQHSLQENKCPCGTACTSWLCFLGWSFRAAQQHLMDFSLAQGPPALRGQATRVPWPTATWIRGYQLWEPSAGSVAATSMSQSHPTPAVSRPVPPIISCLPFLYVYDPYYYWVCILLSHRNPGLHYLFIIALVLALKDIHSLGMGEKWSVEGSGCYHECLVVAQWKTSSCARLNKEGQESFRGQPSLRKHLNSLGKTREIYWKHWNGTFVSFLFITWTQLGFYFQVWRRFLLTGGFTWHHQKGWRILATAQSPTWHQCQGLVALCSPADSQSHRATSDCASELLDSFTPPLHLEKGCTFTKTSSLATDFKCPWMQFYFR